MKGIEKYDKVKIEIKPRGLRKATFLCESYSKSSVNLNYREIEKLTLQGKIVETGKEVCVSEARVLDSEQKITNSGLWINIKDGKLQFGTLAKVLIK